MMLPKCVLCTPPWGGKQHHNQRLAFTKARLHRWLEGERVSLWRDIPSYNFPKRRKDLTPEAETSLKQKRCIDLCREQAFAKSCKALVSKPPLDANRETTRQMELKHPRALRNPDLSSLGSAIPGACPQVESEDVERAVRSFHAMSGAGPSGARPAHFKEASAGAHRDEVLLHLMPWLPF